MPGATASNPLVISNQIPQKTSRLGAFIHGLPSELLQLIFALAYTDHDSIRERMRFAICLSQVSRLWRQTVFAFSMLWREIEVRAPWKPDVISRFLGRTSTHLIDMHVYLAADAITGDNPSVDLDELCSVLRFHAWRYRTIDIQTAFVVSYRAPVVSKFLACFSGLETQNLEQFTISGISVRLPDHLPADLRFFTPMLRGLRLHEASLLHSYFTLGGITSLTLCPSVSVGPTEIQHCLSSCSSLTKLVIYDASFLESREGSFSNLNLPELTTLWMFGLTIPVSDFLSSIRAPKLGELLIAPFFRQDVWTLFGAPGEKFPLLHTLTLSPAQRDAFNALTLAIECFPSIEHLTLSHIYSHSFSQLFTRSAMERGLGVVWPRLQTISLRDIDHINENVVTSMLSFRASQGYPLKKLALDPASYRRMTCIPLLKNWLTVEEYDPWVKYQFEVNDHEDKFIGSLEERLQRSFGQ